MANTRKPRGEKKKPVSFSIKTRVLEDFQDICSRKGLISSHEVEKLIENFNKDML